MSGGLFVITVVIATSLGFFYFSEASFSQSHEAEIAQLSMAGACIALVLYALIRYSFLTCFLVVGAVVAGIFIGKVIADNLAEHS